MAAATSFIPSVPQQVGLYLQHGGKADAKALYVIEDGGNDILGTTTGSPEALAYQIAVGILESERMLRPAGARHFVIPTFSMLAFFLRLQAMSHLPRPPASQPTSTSVKCWSPRKTRPAFTSCA